MCAAGVFMIITFSGSSTSLEVFVILQNADPGLLVCETIMVSSLDGVMLYTAIPISGISQETLLK